MELYSINLNTLSPRLPPDGSVCGIPTVPCSVPIEVGATTAEDRERGTLIHATTITHALV